MESRSHGMALVALAAVLWSTGGYFVRLLGLDVWTMLVWRSVFAAASLCLIVAFLHGRRTPGTVRAIGLPGLVAIPVAAVSMVSYVVALTLTSVANVMVIYATVPFVAAGVAFVWIHERSKPRVLLASGVALAGIAVMAGATTGARDILGNLLAFVMTLTFGVQLVMARRYPRLEMAVVNAAAAALSALVCWPLIKTGVPSPHQLVVLAMFGLMTSGLAYLLFLVGGRYIPSSEAGLLGLLDVVLGPFWVWLAFGERPGQAALLGGGLVLASVGWYLAGPLWARAAQNP